MNNLFNQLEQFKRMLGGRNPQDVLNELIKSGKVTQSQIDEAKKKAETILSIFK